jgi:hypothetical protein
MFARALLVGVRGLSGYQQLVKAQGADEQQQQQQHNVVADESISPGGWDFWRWDGCVLVVMLYGVRWTNTKIPIAPDGKAGPAL